MGTTAGRVGLARCATARVRARRGCLRSSMTREERDLLVAEELLTPAGREKLKEAIQLGAARAADRLPEGCFKWHLARRLAGLPLKRRG